MSRCKRYQDYRQGLVFLAQLYGMETDESNKQEQEATTIGRRDTNYGDGMGKVPSDL